jgi:membrane protein implicated in regulation of membrane protease activity
MLFILLLILLAAAAGVLGAVLKVTLIVVLSLVLSVVVLAWLGVWYAKRRMRRFQRDVEVRIDQARRRREAYDVGNGRSRSSLEGRS